MNLVLFLLAWTFGLLSVRTILHLWQTTTMPVVCALLAKRLGWRRGDDDLWGSIDIHTSRPDWLVWCATVLYQRAPVLAHVMECAGCLAVHISVAVSSVLVLCTWLYGAIWAGWGLITTMTVAVLWLPVGPLTWIGIVLKRNP